MLDLAEARGVSGEREQPEQRRALLCYSQYTGSYHTITWPQFYFSNAINVKNKCRDDGFGLTVMKSYLLVMRRCAIKSESPDDKFWL